MTNIEWTDETWNPTKGCSRVSPGCDNCYAMGQARRQDKPGKPYHGLTIYRESGARKGVDWSGRVRFVPEMLDAPLRWRKPRRVFVNSMSDLFHESLSNEQIAAVFGVMAACPQHTFQVLTKRSKRMREWFEWADAETRRGLITKHGTPLALCASLAADHVGEGILIGLLERTSWSLPNVWLGVSAEDQQRADERIPDLLATPAVVRFVSAEPLLGPVDLTRIRHGSDPDLPVLPDWVIVGGESGQGARPCDVAWIRSIVAQCRAAGVACFVKQLGARPEQRCVIHGRQWREVPGCPRCPREIEHRKGGNPEEWPSDLRVREFPEALP